MYLTDFFDSVYLCFVYGVNRLDLKTEVSDDRSSEIVRLEVTTGDYN